MRPPASIPSRAAFQAALAAGAACLPRWASQALAAASSAAKPLLHGAPQAPAAPSTKTSRPSLGWLRRGAGCALPGEYRELLAHARGLLLLRLPRRAERAAALLGALAREGSICPSPLRDGGQGVIVVTGHLGNWELGGILLALRGLPMTVVTLDEPSTELTRWRDEYRRRLGIKTIAVGPGREFGFVEMIQTLRRGECLAMLVDRPYAGTGTPVRFFGRETEFSSAPALLWQHTGAPVVPALRRRAARAAVTLSFAEPPVEIAAFGADARSGLAANTQAVASVFESIIRRYPEQWFNYVPIWHPLRRRNGAA